MKKQEQINLLLRHVEVLINRVNLLEGRILRLEAKGTTFGPGSVPVTPAPEWPTWKPYTAPTVTNPFVPPTVVTCQAEHFPIH
jgi:hypothetical protein